jgi:hypothetical protein
MGQPGAASSRRELLRGLGGFAAGLGILDFVTPQTLHALEPSGPATSAAGSLGFRIKIEVVSEGYDRKTQWFQPRIGIIPPSTAVLTLSESRVWGSDIFTGIYQMRSDDLGRTWSRPTLIKTLTPHLYPDGIEARPCDLTPAWHAATRKLLMTGHTGNYHPGEKGNFIEDNQHTLDVVYSVYDLAGHTWSEWKTLQMPDRDRFFWASAGCTDRVDLPNGEILLPLYCMGKKAVDAKAGAGCYFTTVVRCAFDGRDLTYVEHGDELRTTVPRGFCEPSLACHDGRFFLTLRNDVKGYVAVSRDGLHFEKPIPWVFDDGRELGSYNTQQHWVTHSDGLFLTYTRRGANNDHVLRHRAPLFIAQVDPQRLCVIRRTEQEVAPNRGAQLGNFGTVTVSSRESWVTTSECMQGDAKNWRDLELTERRGANNRVYVTRILWDRPNRLVAT